MTQIFKFKKLTGIGFQWWSVSAEEIRTDLVLFLAKNYCQYPSSFGKITQIIPDENLNLGNSSAESCFICDCGINILVPCFVSKICDIFLKSKLHIYYSVLFYC